MFELAKKKPANFRICKLLIFLFVIQTGVERRQLITSFSIRYILTKMLGNRNRNLFIVDFG